MSTVWISLTGEADSFDLPEPCDPNEPRLVYCPMSRMLEEVPPDDYDERLQQYANETEPGSEAPQASS
jgi:hypothetical protein